MLKKNVACSDTISDVRLSPVLQFTLVTGARIIWGWLAPFVTIAYRAAIAAEHQPAEQKNKNFKQKLGRDHTDDPETTPVVGQVLKLPACGPCRRCT